MVIRKGGTHDQPAWDDYVLNHPCATPYHRFAWGRAVSEAYDHPMHYLIAEEGRNVCGVLPLVYLKPPLIHGELVSLPFCDVGGVLADSGEVRQRLIVEAFELGRRLGVKRLEIRQAEADLSVEGMSEHPVTVQSHKVRMLLDLPSSSEALMNGFKSKLRSQIRKSEKNGLEFRWGGAEDLDAFYAVFSENMKSLGSPVHSRKWFRAILDAFREGARIGMVFLGNIPAGIGLILCHAGSVTIPWASTDKNFNHLSPNMLLYWNFLKYASDNGYALFDFGRSTPGEGTYKFKEQWGASPVALQWQHIPLCGGEKSIQSSSSSTRALVQNLWKRMPLSLANVIGPFIRKYISL